jgi:integrase
MQGQIKKRKGKRGTTYQVIITYKDQNGDFKKKWKTVKSQQEAERLRNEMLVQAQKGIDINPEKMTVKQFFKKWLASQKDKVSQRTHYDYSLIADKHIIPELGKIHLSKLRPIDLQDFEAKLRESGRKDNKKGTDRGLSSAYVKKIHVIIHEALHDAMKLELVYRNIADVVDPPQVVRAEVIPLNEKEITMLLEGMKDTYLYVPTYIAISTGLRLGEVLGLTWRDIDLEQGILTVREAQKTRRERDGEVITYETTYGAPKSKNSKRSLDIPEALIEVLRKLQLEQETQKRWTHKDVYEDHGLVCCMEDGSPIKNESMGSRFRTLARRLGLNISFHNLRHTHASQLVRMKEDLKVISARLGHSGIGITADTYGHLYPDAQKEAARKINTILKPAMPESESNADTNHA